MVTGATFTMFLVFLLLYSVGAQRIVTGQETGGSLATGNQPAARGNYTVSFVPLISVIANLFPRFLTRFAPQQVQQARSQVAGGGLRNRILEAACNEFLPYKLRWPDPTNRQQFLYCRKDQVCVNIPQRTDENPTSRERKCYSLQPEKCPPNTEFYFNKQRCA